MAQRRRFKPDPDFEMTISLAVSGIEAVGRSGIRRNRVTLQFVADEIVREAKSIVDNQVHDTRGLPSTVRGGRRNAGYDFRRSDASGRTYRASFKTRTEIQRGRLVFIVYNDHVHADDVEYGTDRGGKQVLVARPGHPFALPITKRAYNRIRKNSRAAFIGRGGQAVLLSTQVRTYRGYGILQHAMTTITRRYLRT